MVKIYLLCLLLVVPFCFGKMDSRALSQRIEDAARRSCVTVSVSSGSNYVLPKCTGTGNGCATNTSGNPSDQGYCDFSSQHPCTYCKGSFCDNAVGKCVGAAAYGDSCNTAQNGGPVCGLSIAIDGGIISTDVCNSGICATKYPTLMPGDTCSTSDLTFTTASSNGGCVLGSCSGGKCSSSAIGQACNAGCSSSSCCAQGSYCDITSTKCVAWVSAGGNCTYGQTCSPDSICMPDDPSKLFGTKTCVGLFSVDVSGTCDTNLVGVFGKETTYTPGSGSLVCKAGLSCVADSAFAAAGTCTQLQSPPSTCSVDSDCGSGYICVASDLCGAKTCIFDYTSGDVPAGDPKSISAYQSYTNCLASSSCAESVPWVPYSSSAGSNCAYNNCNSQYTAYINTLPQITGDCILSASSALIPSFLVTVVAVAAYFL